MTRLPKEQLWLTVLAILFGLTILSTVFKSSTGPAVSDGVDKVFSNRPGIGIIHIFGPIVMGAPQSFSSNHGVNVWVQELKAMADDKRIKALILRVDSPGGSVGASQELFDAITRFKQKAEVPVVVSIGDVGASGAYWMAMAADQIYANEGSIVGSIGVLMGQADLSEFKERYGIGVKTYKSGPYKDILSSWREMTPQDDRLIQSLIDDVYDQFVAVVAQGRKKTIAEVKQWADGRIFTGNQAKKLGIIDEVGSFQYVVEQVAAQVGLPQDPPLISKTKRNWMDWVNDLGVSIPFHIEIPGLAQPATLQ